MQVILSNNDFLSVALREFIASFPPRVVCKCSGVAVETETVVTEDLSIHIRRVGSGPLVLLVHGFPDLSLAWHHQIGALAAAGYHAVAPDMRGYGATGGPPEPEAYSIFSLVGDLVALVEALGYRQAVVVGHDWGSAVAWHCALLRPDMFHAVMGMAVPFQPRRRQGPPTAVMRYLAQKNGEDLLYMARFAEPDSHLALDADPETALRKMFWAFDGATAPVYQATGRVAANSSLVASIPDDAVLPPWMDQTLFDQYVAAFRQTGFERAVHWYRKIDANWARTRWLQGRKIAVPSAFLVGEHDPVRRFAGQFEDTLGDWLTDLHAVTVVPNAGHWVQQENPKAVSEAILSFLWGLSLQA